MNDSTVTEEFPVRRPALVQENAFFYNPDNRFYLLGQTPDLHIRINTPPNNAADFLIVCCGLVALLSFLLYGLSPWFSLSFMASLVGFIFSALMITRHKRAYLHRRLAREAYFLNGTLLACVARGGRSSLEVEAQYEFVSPTGITLRGKERKERPDLSGKQLPAPGTPVYVLYFSDKEFYLL